MKKFEYIDRVERDGEEINLYMSLEDGRCYTFTDEEVDCIERTEARLEERRKEREQRRIIRVRKSKRNKRIGLLILAGALLFLLHSSSSKTKETTIEPTIVFEENIKDYDYKAKLVALLNEVEGQYDDINYRNLFYLYYNVYYSGIEGPSLIKSLIDTDNDSSVLTRDDFEYWYEEGNIDFRKFMLYPEQTADMIDYTNMDIYLNFNICLKKEVEEGRLSMDEYIKYITSFLIALNDKDPDMKRVWDYYSEHNSTMDGYIDVKLLCYEDTLKMSK